MDRFGMTRCEIDLDRFEHNIARVKELAGEIVTIGSDAHVADNIAALFERATEVLLDCGFKYYTIFEKSQ